MNALVSIDKLLLSPSQDMRATTLFGTGQIDTIIAAIEKDVRSEIYDIETKEGRERIKSVAYAIARSKTTLDEIGKEHVAHIKAQSAGIDKERKTLRDRLDALKDEIRKPVTDWEEAEIARVHEHEATLVDIIETGTFAQGFPPAAIRQHIERFNALAGRDWQEFSERAGAALAEGIEKLNAALDVAEQRDRDAAELAELRKLKAETEAKAEKARAEADAAQAAADAAEREEARAARAEEEKAAAIDAERRRQEQEAAEAQYKRNMEAIAEKKRQENARHRNKVRAEVCNALTMEAGLTEEQIGWLWEAISTGKIPHVRIEY